MKRVRITIDPPAAYLPPVYELLTTRAAYLSQVHLVNWNVSTPPVGFLLRLRGDYRRYEADLRAADNVAEAEILPVTDRSCYCFLAAESETLGRELFDNFTRGSLMTVPPVECHGDASSTFTLVGTEADIQAAVEEVPEGVAVDVEAVGGERVADDGVLGRLSPRQREAVRAALELGYYDVPRDATGEDVARELDCATATAAEHLRKAEATLVSALLDE
ncbi:MULTISPECIES: helix-turn-helix domain-containing protein [Halorussus]|uniref:helix-turn-helix domain-containing protein n=1 Tax=Halorussus TaxID=1070314 RepID=UPI000E21AA43|nr:MULTISPECIES: helix-turn-helix domain-containing protein [Halorussus]NHN57553.1 bacterio-opsin activator [Halorussus sp. JP-T4]